MPIFKLLPDGRTERRLVLAALVDSTGTGLYIAGSALYYTTQLGFSPRQIGLGLSLMGLVGLLVTVPIGRLVDQLGPRRVLVALNLWRAVGFGALAFIQNWPQFLVVAALLGVAEFSAVPARQAYVGHAFDSGERVAVMARMRVAYNTGFALGSLLTTVVVALASRLAYGGMLVADGLSFAVAAWLVAGLPDHRSEVTARRRGFSGVGDARFIGLACVNGVLVLHIAVLGIGFPLWIARATRASAELVPILITINTVLNVCLQVACSRGADTLLGAGRCLRRAGVALAVTCGALALAARLDTGPADAVLVAGVVLLTLGEMWQSAGGWGVLFSLTPAESRSSYAATFNLGVTVEGIVGPSLVGGFVLAAGTTGWAVLATLFLAAGLAGGAACRWRPEPLGSATGEIVPAAQA